MALRVLYVFTARKRGLVDAVARGDAPDTLLFGLNHLASHGIEADFYEPDHGAPARFVARQVGRLGPDALQLRTLPRFARYDVVFLTGAWPLLVAARATLRKRCPKLVWLNMTLTNVLRRGGWTGRAVSAAVRCADRIVCVAEHQRRFLHERLAVPYDRLPLALSGSDARFYNSNGATAPDGTGGVLAVGRDAGRDYATLLASVRGIGVDTRIVCSPRNVAGLRLPENVTARFDIPQPALRAEYAGATAVVVPTYGDRSTAGSDCSGTLVLLDALAMGRPAVIAERASVSDYVVAGRHAEVYRPGDASDLRTQLERVLDDRAAAGRMAEAGRAEVLERLTTVHFAERIAGLLHQAASTG